MSDYLTPDARRRIAGGLMAAQYNRATPEEGNVAQRHGLLPLATYDNGQTGLAFPGIVAEPVESFGRLLQNGYQGGTGDTQGVEDAFNVAGAAMVGGVAAPKPSGVIGSAGGNLKAPQGPMRVYHGTASEIEKFGSPTFWALSRGEADDYRAIGSSGANVSGLESKVPNGYVAANSAMQLAGGDRASAIAALERQSRFGSEVPWWKKSFGMAKSNASDANAAKRASDALDYMKKNNSPGSLGRIYSGEVGNPQKSYTIRDQADITSAIDDATKNGYSVIEIRPERGGAEIVTLSPDAVYNVSTELFSNGGKGGAAMNALLQYYGIEDPSRPASPKYSPGDA